MSRFLLVASLLIVVFSSCTTIQTMCYERLCPADVVFVEQIRKVGIVNNMPAVQQDYEQVDYASASLEGDGAVTVEALAQEVASAEYFDEVVVYDKQFRRSSYPLDQPIPKATVDGAGKRVSVGNLTSRKGKTRHGVSVVGLSLFNYRQKCMNRMTS